MRAHPRVGGENLFYMDSRVCCNGSSPRGRGKRRRGAHASDQRRLIPAWAGKTSSPLSQRRSLAAHPRVGGENATDVAIPALQDGSSPRGRGKRAIQGEALHIIGLIPAWAGKTSDPEEGTKYGRAHPRVGGENRPCRRTTRRGSGSSPRGRGKLDFNEADVIGFGLIPAWAGKTRRCPAGHLPSGAHPRVGGENVTA